MELIRELFLEALGASLSGKQVAWDMDLKQEDWTALFTLAQEQQTLPMVFEAVYACPAAGRADPKMMMFFRRQAMRTVMLQTVKTRDFLSLVEHLRGLGIDVCVVKGIVCRTLYLQPDHRFSGDEDILIPPEQLERCRQALDAYGMQICAPQRDVQSGYEVAYNRPGSPLYIELHKHLFPPENEAYGDLNRFFEDVHARVVEYDVGGRKILTMQPTDHFFYLICHSFKHFLHSGFGLRQVCDIALFANRFGGEIDWMRVLDMCTEIRAERFAASVLKIGEKHFGFDPDTACYPAAWRGIEVDEGPMLKDLLDSGIYGDVSMSRKHSSTMTIHAVMEDRRGKIARGSVMRTLFPKAKMLENRFLYLKKYPWLLPAAWAARFYGYCKERRFARDNNPRESLRIGSERVALMRKYGIIK